MIRIRVSARVQQPGLSLRSAARTIRMVCRYCSVRNADISIVYLNDRQMKLMNTKFLKHAFITDIITIVLEWEPVLEAEIYIGSRQAVRQARTFGITVVNEMTRLLVHGTLHACGYDDRRTKDRKKMLIIQEVLVKKIRMSKADYRFSQHHKEKI